MMSHSHVEADSVRGDHDPIVVAAMAVLTELGPSRMTMAEVARRAGVSRMTVYRRYRSLEALVSAVLTAEIADVVGEVVGEVAARLPAEGTVRERSVATSVAVVSALIDHTLLQAVLEVDPQSLLPLLVERIGSGQRLLMDHLALGLAQGMASRGGDGSIRDADPHLLALSIVSIAQPFVMGMRPLRREYPEHQLLDELATLIDCYLRGE